MGSMGLSVALGERYNQWVTGQESIFAEPATHASLDSLASLLWNKPKPAFNTSTILT